MNNLKERISNLTDSEAVQATGYVTELMQEDLKKANKLSEEAANELNDDLAVDMLSEELSSDISAQLEQASLRATESERGQVARNILTYLSEETEYADMVNEAIDQLVFKADPMTLMAIGTCIVFIMQLEFDFDIKKENGKLKWNFSMGKKPTSEKLIGKVLNPAVPAE